MTWDERIEKVEKVINLLIKLEAHALFLVVCGALMCLHGNKDEGQLIMGAGLAVFKNGSH
jgi:hypothetical protein